MSLIRLRARNTKKQQNRKRKRQRKNRFVFTRQSDSSMREREEEISVLKRARYAVHANASSNFVIGLLSTVTSYFCVVCSPQKCNQSAESIAQSASAAIAICIDSLYDFRKKKEREREKKSSKKQSIDDDNESKLTEL